MLKHSVAFLAHISSKVTQRFRDVVAGHARDLAVDCADAEEGLADTVKFFEQHAGDQVLCERLIAWFNLLRNRQQLRTSCGFATL